MRAILNREEQEARSEMETADELLGRRHSKATECPFFQLELTHKVQK